MTSRGQSPDTHGLRTRFEARIEREGGKSLVAWFGGIPLKRQKNAVLTDREHTRPVYPNRKLVTRLLKGRCECCGRTDGIQVHHARAPADLSQPGQPQPRWAQVMAAIRRKTLVVCGGCHDLFHGHPAARFTAPAGDGLGLRIPAELTGQPQLPAAAGEPEPDDGAAAPPPPDPGSDSGQGKAWNWTGWFPRRGNLWIAGQQVWLGPAMTGRTVRLWAGLKQVHVLLDGHRIKTLPSRLDARDLARTVACAVPPEAWPRLRGARPGTAQPPRLAAPLVTAARTTSRDIRGTRHRPTADDPDPAEPGIGR